MADVKQRPVDGPEGGLIEALRFGKTSDVSGFVDVVGRHTRMITMLSWKGDAMLTCCVVASQPDAGDLLRFVADGQFLVVDALNVRIDNLPEVEQGRL